MHKALNFFAMLCEILLFVQVYYYSFANTNVTFLVHFFTRKSNENVFLWPLKACPLKWDAQSRVSWNIYLQTVYIIKNNNDFYSSCSKQNFNMQRHPAMSEQNKKKIKTMYRVTVVNPDVSPTHRPMLHIFPINPRCLTVFLIHSLHRLIIEASEYMVNEKIIKHTHVL